MRRLTTSRCPAAVNVSHRSAVRRSCHTMARPNGRPVERLQATTVSRWFVMPMHRGGPSRSASSAHTASVVAQISSASCSTQPGCGKYCGNSR